MNIKVFTAEQYLDKTGLLEKTQKEILLLDEIISLEIAIYHMRNTSMARECDGFNIDTVNSIRSTKIDKYNEISNEKYLPENDFWE